jgi:regulator of RNase E activity RraA
LSPTTLEWLKDARLQLTTSLAADALRAHDPTRFTMRGVTHQSGSGSPTIGPARTLRFLPSRSDIGAGPNGNARMTLIDDANPGDVLVFDALGFGGPVFGDMTGLRAIHVGVAAVITDGVVRDADALNELGLAVYAARTSPALVTPTIVPWEFDVPIACGGVLVMPGDWIVADRDGVMVIPETLLDVLVRRAQTILAEETFSAALLRSGQPLRTAYPLPAPLQRFFERYRADGSLPSADEIRNALG